MLSYLGNVKGWVIWVRCWLGRHRWFEIDRNYQDGYIYSGCRHCDAKRVRF